MLGEHPCRRGAEGDLEAELAVGADERRGDGVAQRDAFREVFLQAEVQRLSGELGATLVSGAGC